MSTTFFFAVLLITAHKYLKSHLTNQIIANVFCHLTGFCFSCLFQSCLFVISGCQLSGDRAATHMGQNHHVPVNPKVGLRTYVCQRALRSFTGSKSQFRKLHLISKKPRLYYNVHIIKPAWKKIAVNSLSNQPVQSEGWKPQQSKIISILVGTVSGKHPNLYFLLPCGWGGFFFFFLACSFVCFFYTMNTQGFSGEITTTIQINSKL